MGVSHSLNTGDTVFGAHRSHGHLLALSDDPYPLFAEALGRSTGASKGMGGSITGIKHQVSGSVSAVAGSVSLAVGSRSEFHCKKIKKMLLLPIWVM